MNVLPKLLWFMIGMGTSSYAAEQNAHLIVDKARQVQQTLLALRSGPKPSPGVTQSLLQVTREGRDVLLQSRLPSRVDGPAPDSHETVVLTVKGDLQVVLEPGQRSCEAITADWSRLDTIYNRVNELAVQLDQAYRSANPCSSCLDKLLQALSQSTLELETLSNRLTQDGNRMVAMSWSPQSFNQSLQAWNSAHTQSFAVYSLDWSELAYVNSDGDSQLADPQALILGAPLEQGAFYHLETSAERACSPSLELRFDGHGQAKTWSAVPGVRSALRMGRAAFESGLKPVIGPDLTLYVILR